VRAQGAAHFVARQPFVELRFVQRLHRTIFAAAAPLVDGRQELAARERSNASVALRLLVLSLAFLAACSPQPPVPRIAAQHTAPESAPAATMPTIPDFVSLVRREGGTVVNISTTRTVRGLDIEPEIPGLSPDDPLYELFRRLFPPGPREYQAQSLGSGFIISEDGYVLTNAHVVADMDEATVKLLDRREFKAKVVGIDRRTDVALVKIAAKGLRKVTIGDPLKLEVGEWVAAIGSPFGFENSVTAGIVSAKGRFVPDETYVPYIQTDVAVNPGNSGGPLFNLRGEVVGINSMIYSGSGGYMGLSFAVPIDVAVKVANELRVHGKVIRGRLGVRIQEVTPDLARSFGLKSATGALVLMVERASPAEKAGIVPGDVILKVGGKAIETSSDLPQIIGATPPGTTITMEVWRRGVRKQLAATIAELASGPLRMPAEPETKRANRLGLVLSELTPDQRGELRTEGGLLVRSVRGPALTSGIQAGDVIVAINDRKVDRVADLNDALAAAAPGASVALLIQRAGALAYVPVHLSD
jgi:serine protease Do